MQLVLLAALAPMAGPSAALAAPPPNDNAADAIELFPNSDSASFDNSEATTEPDEAAVDPFYGGYAGQTPNHSVWYRFEAPGTGSVKLDTCGSPHQFVVDVFDMSTSPPTEVVEDFGCGGPPTSLKFDTLGGSYLAVVDSPNGTLPAGRGAGVINLTGTFAPPPNDDFTDAQVLTGSPVQGGGWNTLATTEPGEPHHGGDPGGRSLWYGWTAPVNGTATVDLCGADFDAIMGVYTGGQVDALTAVPMTAEACSVGGSMRKASFPISQGTTYRIAVDGRGGDRGGFGMSLAYTQAAENPGNPPSGGSGPGEQASSFSAGRIPLRKLLRSGLPVSFTCSGACTAKFELLMSRRAARKMGLAAATPVVIGRANKALLTPGSGKAVVKLTAKAKRRLKRVRSVVVTLRGRFADAAGKKTVQAKKLTLKR
jgi:hypothetical protein